MHFFSSEPAIVGTSWAGAVKLGAPPFAILLLAAMSRRLVAAPGASPTPSTKPSSALMSVPAGRTAPVATVYRKLQPRERLQKAGS